jgi:hypothetical protein
MGAKKIPTLVHFHSHTRSFFVNFNNDDQNEKKNPFLALALALVHEREIAIPK